MSDRPQRLGQCEESHLAGSFGQKMYGLPFSDLKASLLEEFAGRERNSRKIYGAHSPSTQFPAGEHYGN